MNSELTKIIARHVAQQVALKAVEDGTKTRKPKHAAGVFRATADFMTNASAKTQQTRKRKRWKAD